MLRSQIKNEIAPLTGFRFITAFMIFLSHAALFLGLKFDFWVADTFLANSSVFMSGFFVLSGYILTQLYAGTDFTQKKEVWNFYIRRFARIYPVYIFVTVVFFFLFPSFIFTPTDWVRIVINDLFLTQGFFPNVSDLGINCVTWSISVEAFFYLCFPLLITLFKSHARLLLFLAGIMSFVISVNIIGDVHTNLDSIHRLAVYYTNPVFRLSEFMIGISFNLLKNEGCLDSLPYLLNSCVFVFCLIISLALTPLASEKYSHMAANFILVPLFGVLIVNFHNIKSGFLQRSSVLNFLGKISYSFYLWQFLIIICGIFMQKTSGFNTLALVAFLFFINVILSCLSYVFLEVPARRILLKFIDDCPNFSLISKVS